MSHAEREASGGYARGQLRFEARIQRPSGILVCNPRENQEKTARRIESIAPPLLNNIRNFVCSASVLLAVWLGATFVNKVPSHRYPSLGKGPASTASITESSAAKIANVANAVDSGKGRLATLPVSR